MKLVIFTQIKENYGAHAWDGKGECPQRWKFKGGNTIIVRDITVDQAMKLRTGIPTLTALIEENNEYFEEYILDWDIMDDCVGDPIEDWDSPIENSWGGDRWLAQRVVDNTKDGGYYRYEIASAKETWIPMEGGEKSDFKVEYTMRNGDVLNYEELQQFFSEAS